jgi:stage V sporulation protein D (sporulation-specific penicillin-binding protein)
MAKITMDNQFRIIVSFIVLCVLFVALVFRTAWIQIVRSDYYSQKAVSQQMSDIPLDAKRGSIYDRNGKEMATSATCYSVWIRPKEIRMDYNTDEKRDELASKLAVILNKDAAVLDKQFSSRSNLIQIAKYQSKSDCDKLREQKITGLQIVKSTRRYYPLGSTASRLLGSVSDENEGRTGIEAHYDAYLSGVSGRWIKDTDVNGNALAYGNKKLYKAKDGYNLTLTIDEVIQHYTEKAVNESLKKTDADKVMCLVMDPKTGDILAMATNPGFNPNDATEPVSKKEKTRFKKLSSEKQSEYLSSMWKNPVVSDLYEPGSTFKLITTSSALEEGVTKPSSVYYDPGVTNINGTRIHCSENRAHGRQTLAEAVGNSCNYVQIKLALGLGKNKYYNYLEMFGITDKTNVGLPAETTAMVKNKKDLMKIDLATMGYGQGIAVTPIQLLTAVCSIGNDGVMMKPRIVKNMTDSDGKVVKEYRTEKIRKVISSKTASEMKKIMEYVVTDGGGTRAKIAGYRIGGKTGTANKIKKNGGYSGKTVASFIGMAPMDDPQMAVLVVVDNPKKGKFGGVVAAPVAKKIMQNTFAYLDIKPKYTKSEKADRENHITQVPDVTGKRSGEAIALIAAKNLKYKIMPKTRSKKSFRVVDQYPKAGKVVSTGKTVYIYRK